MNNQDFIEAVYKGIERCSFNLIKYKGESSSLRGAKNFICTPDLQSWTYGKSVGAKGYYHRHGGAAKILLKRKGFVNILENDTISIEVKTKIIDAFETWACNVEQFDLIKKFKHDQETKKRFEILVHMDVLKSL
jgi:hypothetical protein